MLDIQGDRPTEKTDKLRRLPPTIAVENAR